MTKFTDGPAAGHALMLSRSPLFLRVTRDGDLFDALDQPGDAPNINEALWAYRRVSHEGSAHVSFSDRRSWSGPIATYALVAEQPPDEVMRDNERWSEWCHAQ